MSDTNVSEQSPAEEEVDDLPADTEALTIEPMPPEEVDVSNDAWTRLADETGAQAMEYAMLSGAGVASVTFLTWMMRQPWFADAMEGLLSGLLDTLSRRVTDLLPFLGSVV